MLQGNVLDVSRPKHRFDRDRRRGVFTGSGSRIEAGLASDQDLELYLKASSYDPWQHGFHNLASRSAVGPGLPGAVHPLFFSSSTAGPYVYEVNADGHEVGSTLTANMLSLTAYRLEMKLNMVDWAGGTRRLLTIGGTVAMVQMKAGSILSWVANGVTADADAAHAITTGLTAWIAIEVDGTSVDFYTSTDDTATWDAVGGNVTAGGTMDLPGSGDVLLNSHTTTFGHDGRFYEAVLRSSASASGTIEQQFNAGDFIFSNRGHGATVDDAQGNTWTVSRAGAPLSVIDNGDGTGKRTAAGAAAAGQSLINAAGVDFLSTDVFRVEAKLKMTSWTSGTASMFAANWNDPTDRGWGFYMTAAGLLQLWWTTDGSSAQFAGGSSAVTFADDAVGYVALEWDPDGGAGNVEYFESTDGETWSSLGTTTAAGPLYDNAAQPIEVGSYNNGTANEVFPYGSIYWYKLKKNGIVVSHFDASLIDINDWRQNNMVEASTVTGEAWAVTYTDSAEDSADPVMPYHSEDFFHVDGSTTNGLALPDNAAFDFATDTVMQIDVRMAADDYTPAADEALVAKWLEAGDQRSFRFSIDATGAMIFERSTDGAVGTVAEVASDNVIPVVNGQWVYGRMTWDITAAEVKFYTSPDGSSFTQLGATETLATKPFDGTATLECMATEAGANDNYTGRLAYASLSKDSTEIARFDPADIATGDGTSFTDSVSSLTCTIARATSGFATAVVTGPVILHGGAHYITIPYHPDLDDYALSVFAAGRMHDHTDTDRQWVTRKADATDNTVGWQIQQENATEVMTWMVASGAANTAVNAAGSAYTLSTRFVFAGSSGSATDHEAYLAGASVDTDATSITPILTTADLVIGANGAAGNDIEAGETFAVSVLSKRVTDAEAAMYSNELAATS